MTRVDWYDLAEQLPDVFGQPQISPQGQDGVPHLRYFDNDTALCFIWNGHLEQHVVVSYGGDSEPVRWTFDFMEMWNYGVPDGVREMRTPQFSYRNGFHSAPYHLKQACDNWIAKMEKEKEISPDRTVYTSCFDESNPNWTPQAEYNYLFLKGIQSHMNHLLQLRGHVFLNDVYDALGIPRTGPGAIMGWLKGEGAGFVDFIPVGYPTDGEPSVWLEFNVDGDIHEKI